MTEDQKALLANMELIRAHRRSAGQKGEGWAYDSPEHFVMEHGEWFWPRSLPAEYEYGEFRRCYSNAFETALHHELEYVEGYALGMGMQIHHAWCVDAKGLVIDTTWPVLDTDRAEREPPATAYYGVRFPIELVYDCLSDGSGSVLDDWERGGRSSSSDGMEHDRDRWNLSERRCE